MPVRPFRTPGNGRVAGDQRKDPCRGCGAGFSRAALAYLRFSVTRAVDCARPLLFSTRGPGAAGQISWRSRQIPGEGTRVPFTDLAWVLDRGWSPDLTRFPAGTRVPGEGVRGMGPEWSALPAPLQFSLQFSDPGLGFFGAGSFSFGPSPFLREGGYMLPGLRVVPAHLSVFPLDEAVEHAAVTLKDSIPDGLDSDSVLFRGGVMSERSAGLPYFPGGWSGLLRPLSVFRSPGHGPVLVFLCLAAGYPQVQAYSPGQAGAERPGEYRGSGPGPVPGWTSSGGE